MSAVIPQHVNRQVLIAEVVLLLSLLTSPSAVQAQHPAADAWFEEAVMGDNVDAVVQRARNLPLNQRFDFLCRHVLPHDQRRSFRVRGRRQSVDFSFSDSTATQIVSPVLELIDCAKQTKRLDELLQSTGSPCPTGCAPAAHT